MSANAFLNPTPSLCAKLGSIAVHAEEILGADGHHFDRLALETVMRDPEVVEWLKQGRKLAMIPEMRNADSTPRRRVCILCHRVEGDPDASPFCQRTPTADAMHRYPSGR